MFTFNFVDAEITERILLLIVITSSLRYKNGEEVTPSKEAKVEVISETTCRLTIPCTTEDDTADYKVILLASFVCDKIKPNL